MAAANKPVLFQRPEGWDEMTQAERDAWGAEIAALMGVPKGPEVAASPTQEPPD